MKKNYTKLVVVTAFIFCGMAKNKAQTITLVPKIGGSSGSTVFTDASTFQIGSSGVVSYTDTPEDWTMTAQTITQTGALGKNFIFKWGGMASVNTTEGNDYGKMLTAGGIHRNTGGELGISQGTTGGIDAGEGYFFGLDATGLGTGVAVQITKVMVKYLNGSGATGSVETGAAISLLDPTKRIVFGNSGQPGINFTLSGGAGTIDVSSFKLYVAGGSANNSLLSVISNNSSTNSDWRIIGIELKVADLNTLPVSFDTFTATAEAQGVKLQWRTLSEQDNKKFIILRSVDGKDFRPITTIAGTGNSSSPKSYQFYDRSAANGINYYKLLQIDNDGNKIELDIKSVIFNLTSYTSNLKVFPNPSSNEASVTFKPNVFHTLFLTNLQGKVLHTLSVGKDVSEAKLDLRQYTTGTYLVELKGAQTIETSKLIKR